MITRHLPIFASKPDKVNNKLTYGIIAVLLAVVGYLGYQQINLRKELREAKEQKDAVSITPIAPGSATGGEESPFSKPNVDPMARDFPETKTPPELTAITFDRTTHDFGRIKEGDKVRTVFHFKNTGKKPLIISSATTTCGCTVPNWPKAAIAPGEGGDINVEFDSEGKKGQVEKEVTVTANVDPPATILSLKSVIVPREK